MAAAACVAGLDGMRILRTEDPIEALVGQAVALRAVELREREQKNLAVFIRDEIGKMF